ncbi:De-etiolated protein 1 Det1-domain-containing protein [Syncephalis fuscata]|nr:De-etiolated protein 1 Det1-domain-containing protein [Syncephalis fuscata]
MNNSASLPTSGSSSRTKSLQRPGLLPRLWRREYELGRPNTQWRRLRSSYLEMCPNDAIFNVQIPRRLILKRFSPDGKFLIAFSGRLQSVAVFTFHGPCLQTDINNQALSEQPDIHQHISLFSSDTRFLLVITARQTDKLGSQLRPGACTIPESTKLETYRLHVINISTGEVTDIVTIELDFIRFEKHPGLILRGNMIAIISIYDRKLASQHQGAEQLLRENYGFEQEQEELPLREDIDRETILLANEMAKRAKLSEQGLARNESTGLHSTNPLEVSVKANTIRIYILNKGSAIMNFYYIFPYISNLIFYKAQFVDDTHLMIRFCTREAFISCAVEGIAHTFFLVVYDIPSTRVVAAFENTSEPLLKLVEQGVDFLRGPMYNFPIQQHSSFSNNLQTNQLYHRQQYTLQNARNGSQTQAVRHLLSMLPFSPQTLLNRHSWTVLYSPTMRKHSPRSGHDFPVKFFDRRTGQLRFKLFTYQPHSNPETLPKRYTHFIFHPTLPFAMAVQQPPKQTFYYSPTIICYYRRPKWGHPPSNNTVPLATSESAAVTTQNFSNATAHARNMAARTTTL